MISKMVIKQSKKLSMAGSGQFGRQRINNILIMQLLFLDARQQIVLDECHKAKNLVPTGSSKPTKTGLAVLELQNKLPKARVVYCSATGKGI